MRVSFGQVVGHAQVGATVGLSLTVAALSCCVAAALIAPRAQTPLSAYMVPVQEERASAALGGDSSLSETETTKVIALAPATATAWLRLAYIDAQRPEGLNSEGLAALEQSYEVAPLGPDVSSWRLRFMFENWGQLTPGLRSHALDEMTVHVRGRPDRARRMVITDPAGRLAAAFAIRLAGQNVRESARTDVIR